LQSEIQPEKIQILIGADWSWLELIGDQLELVGAGWSWLELAGVI
jgi:hypothetical protein